MVEIVHPWQNNPTELIAFAIEQMHRDGDINQLAAFLILDVGVETLFRTFLNLPAEITGTQIPNKERKELVHANFPELCAGVARAAATRLNEDDLKSIRYYHDLRNRLYHEGEGAAIPRRIVRLYAHLAVDLLDRLLGMDLKSQLQDSPAPGSPTGVKSAPPARANVGALYKTFFEDLLAQLRTARPDIGRAMKAGEMNAVWFGAGRADFALGWSFPQGRALSVDFFIYSGDKLTNKRHFDKLFEQKDQIEHEIGTSLIWDRLNENKQSRVRVTTPCRVTDPPERLEVAKAWALETMIKFADAFKPRIQAL